MQTVIGLGNPGEKYKNTRHNIGFSVIDRLTHELDGEWTHICDSEVFTTQIAGQKTLFTKPQTFMNNSGKAVECMYNKNDLKVENIIVIYDDIDLPFGDIRIRKGGGTGGHNGMESIVESLGSHDFIRIRIGIGRPEKNTTDQQIADYVLEEFTTEEKKSLARLIDEVTKKTRQLLKFGYEEFASKYNK